MSNIRQQRGLTDREAGELIANISHIREAQAQHQQMMEKILHKMDGYITHKDFEEYKANRQQQTDDRYVMQRDIQGLVNLWGFVSSTFGKVVATALVGVVVAMTYQIINSTMYINEFRQAQVARKGGIEWHTKK